MKLNIYNNNNEPTEVDTGDKEIRDIEVTVVNGNEFIWIYYKDTLKLYKSYPYKENNCINYCYIVTNRFLKYWIELKKDEIPTGYSIGEYRLEKFTGDNGKTEKWIEEY